MTTTRPPIFTYCFNPEENGGEAIFLSALIERQDPDDPYVTEKFSMQSYANEASFHFNFFLTPDRLRDCANKLEKFLIANGLN
jgi:hypothetical protein